MSELLARRMMSKSFEKVYSMQLLHIRAIFAQSTLAYGDQRDPAPPPFSLLTLPHKTFTVLFGLCQCDTDGYEAMDRSDGYEKAGERQSARRSHGRPEYISFTALKQDVEELQKKMDYEVQRQTSRIKEEEHVAEEIRSALTKVRTHGLCVKRCFDDGLKMMQ